VVFEEEEERFLSLKSFCFSKKIRGEREGVGVGDWLMLAGGLSGSFWK